MIDEAHQLTKDAFNALLKTLEEPPEHLKFVLATTDPDKMLPTVLSRCLQFNLRPMAPEVVRAHLQEVLAKEAVPFDDGALRLLAHAARGSMRDALSLTDQAIAYGSGRLEEAAVRAMLGAVDERLPADLVRALAGRDGAAVLAGCDRLRDGGQSATATLEQVAQLLQRVAVEQMVPGALGDDDPLAPAARELAPQLAPDETQLLYGIVLHGRQELAWMSDEYAAFTMVLLRYLAFPPAGGAAPAAARAAPLRAPAPPATAVRSNSTPPATAVRSNSTPPAAAERPATAPAAHADRLNAPRPALAPDAPPDTALGDRWLAAVKALIDGGAVSGLVRELAWQGELVAIEPGDPAVWHLRVEHDALRASGLRDKLAEALAAALAQPLRLEIALGRPADSPARREADERARRQQAAEAAIMADPDVRALLDQFKTARIVPGSIKPI
jgi:DNA polymerase-3 subunit gamma/tau